MPIDPYKGLILLQRFIGRSGLQAVRSLRNLGFIDVQDLHMARVGTPPAATCRSKTRRDFLFVSAELAAQFSHCYLDPLEWSDHANLVGVFSFQARDLERFPWPKPDPIPWQELRNVDPGAKISFANPANCDDAYIVCCGNRLRMEQRKVLGPRGRFFLIVALAVALDKLLM